MLASFVMSLFVRTLLVTGPPDEVEPAARRHAEHLRELKRKGKLHTAARFKNGDGFLEIFEAADLREAQVFAAASPLIAEGLATGWSANWTTSSADRQAGGSIQRPCSLISSTRRWSAVSVGMFLATISLPTNSAILFSPQPT